MFDLKKTLLTVGTSLLASNPVGLAALPLINAFLPDDKKLPEHATGEQALAAVETLSAEQQQQIALSAINLKVEQEKGQTERYVAMCKADGQVTRAKMALRAMNALIAITLLFICSVAYVYVTDGATLAFSYEMATVFLVVSGTFAYVVRAYFGDLISESKSRHLAINNQLPAAKGLAGIIQSIKGM